MKILPSIFFQPWIYFSFTYKASQAFFQENDTLVSMSKEVGGGFLKGLSYLFTKVYFFVVGDAKDFVYPYHLRKIFNEDPFKVINLILDLLDKNPSFAQKILINLANDWKKCPKDYLLYNKEFENRKRLICCLNEIMLGVVLSNDERNFNKRIVNGELSELEALYIRDNPAYESIKEKEKAFKEHLWSFVYALIMSEEELSGLNCHVALEDPFRLGEMTFGSLIEKLMYTRKLRHLQIEKSFNFWANFLRKMFRQILEKKELNSFPKIKTLVQKAHKILSNKEKRKNFHDIICKLIAIHYS